MKIPRWLRITLIVVAVLIVVALIVPFFMDVDSYRPTIVSAIEKASGRKAEIGKIRARLIPSVGFTIETVRLGNPPGFAPGNVLEIESVRGTLAWGPLFRREFQISAVELVRPKLWLLENERGKSNYDFSSPEKKSKGPSGSTFTLAAIDSIELLDMDLMLGRVAGRRTVPSLRVRNLSATLGNVELDASKIKQWRADAELDGVELELPGFKKPLEFKSGAVTLRNGTLEAKDLRAVLGNAVDARGTVRVGDVEKGLAQFDLSTGVLDLDALAAASGERASSSSAASGPSKLLARGKIAADRVRYGKLEARQGRAEMRVYSDRVELTPVSMSLYGGTLSGSLRLDQRQAASRIAVTLEARKLDVASLLEATGSSFQATGTGEMNLTASGSTANLADSLTGNGNVAVRDGKLPGLNLGKAMQTLAKVQSVLGRGGAATSNETPFRSITADMALGNARISSQRIYLDSPMGTVEMRGSVGFDKTLAYEGKTELQGGAANANNPVGLVTGILSGVSKQNVSCISVPFSLGGTLDNPKAVPKGIPAVCTSSTTAQEGTQTQQPEKKKSILDLFRKP
jgi:uncharacterized protein involved in outer membrane biogenesis